jgi:Glycosyl transferase family 2
MITFIATAYKETVESHLFISSLLLQKDDRWKCIIYCDEKNDYIENVLKQFSTDKFSIIYNETPTGFWGHYNRIKALELVETDYVLQTSIQDYYLPNTVSELHNLMNNYDFIFFNSLHNHFKYNVLDSQPRRTQIDWGSFIVRTEIAKQINIENPKSDVCDGIFVEECMKYPNIRSAKIKKILTVHN